MFESSPNIPQWSELGEQLSGPDGERVRESILQNLAALEQRAESEMASPQADAPRTQALLEAIQIAKKLAESLFKPVDLSTL